MERSYGRTPGVSVSHLVSVIVGFSVGFGDGFTTSGVKEVERKSGVV